MQHRFAQALTDVETLAIAKERVIETLAIVKADRHKHLGFVSGIISSDGDEYIERNIRLLAGYTDMIRRQQSFSVFAATDVFNAALFEQLAVMHMDRAKREAQFLDLWRAVLSSGHITHVFMTPRWEQSAGASDEHETAKRLGLTIEYIPKNVT